jgi:predicted amino acid-binding ACT domain protein
MQTERTLTLTMTCPDGVGIVAAVSQFLADRGGWIVEANHHSDRTTGRFFMRNVILGSSIDPDTLAQALEHEFAPIAQRFGMTWRLADSARRKRKDGVSACPEVPPRGPCAAKWSPDGRVSLTVRGRMLSGGNAHGSASHHRA